MYPQAETAGGRKDSLAPDTFRYQITAREVSAADTGRSVKGLVGRRRPDRRAICLGMHGIAQRRFDIGRALVGRLAGPGR